MLYDPKWDVLYTTKNFAAWLSKQPRSKTYAYGDVNNCAVAQYLKAHGVADYRLDHEEVVALGWHPIVNDGRSYTFGAAARRAQWAAGTHWMQRLFGLSR